MKKYLLAIALFCAIQVNQHEAISTPPPSGPTTISYQGVLTDGSDELLTDGEYSVTFKLYDVTSGGTALWTETQTVTTTNGLFNVDLGSVTGVTGVDFSKQLYLEVTVGSTTLSPRIKFTAQPYAFMAKTITETLPVAKGGTGATTAESARTNLGLGLLSVEDYIGNDMWSGEDLSIENGGTGASNIEDARSNLGLGSMALEDYVYDNMWSGSPLSIEHGGTGASNIEDARSNLGLGLMAVEDNIIDDMWLGAPLSLSHGGTGVDNLDDLKLALDLGTMSSQSADAVEITGGAINGTAIGATSTASGAFSDLSSTNDANFNGVSVGRGGGNVSSNTLVGNDAMTATATGVNNTGVGYKALQSNTTGSHNTAIGRGALLANTTGSENTAVGRNALITSTEASANTGIGYFALNANTTGTENTAVGGYSGRSNTTGNYNASFGYHSLYNNTTGSNNTAVGNTAAASNTTGEYNTAVGIAAMEKNTTGNRNTALGHQALYGEEGSTTGSENTAVGSSALYKNTTGEGNIAIGYQAGFGTNEENEQSKTDNYAIFIGYQASRALETNEGTSLNNVTAIGKNARVRTDNSMVLGGFGEDAISVGIGTDSPVAKLDIVQDAPFDALSIIQNENSNALVIQQNGSAPGLQLNLVNPGPDADAENIGIALDMDPTVGDNLSNNANMRGLVISNKSLGDNSVGAEFYMNGGGTEEKGIYIDLASGYDFDAEDYRMGVAIGINDGYGLMVANTNSEPITVKLATNNNALEIVGSSSITGSITLEEESPLIQGTGEGEFLVSSNGSLKFESANDNDITIAPGTGGNLVIPGGTEGQVLTYDANGNAVWADAASGGSGGSGGGGVELLSTNTFSGTTTSSTYIVLKTITVPSTGLFKLTSFISLDFDGQNLNEFSIRLKQGSNVLTGMSGISTAFDTYGKLDDVIELSSTDDLSLEINTHGLNIPYSGNVKLLKLTEPGGSGGGSTAVPTVLQEIFTNQSITIDGTETFAVEFTKTVTGAQVGDAVILNMIGLPEIHVDNVHENLINYNSWVSANDTVTIRVNCSGVGTNKTFNGIDIVVTVIRPIQD